MPTAPGSAPQPPTSASSRYGGHSMVAPLRRVLVRAPDASFGAADPQRWHYTARPDLPAARREHDALVALLAESGAEVVQHAEPLDDRADALFVFDPVLMTDGGAVVLRMAKALRRGEEAAMAAALQRAGIPLLGQLEAPALAEGGDLVWLDGTALAVGLGFRTNAEGARQLAALLAPLGVRVLPVELPVFGGPDACLHLMSLLSLVDVDLAVVYPSLLSVPFWQRLVERGLSFVEVPPEELATQGTNVLAVAPRDVIVLDGSPRTRARLEAAGCRVRAYRGEEISLKAEGGPTCLTRPLWREVDE
jgi:dimethylargininase